MYSAGWHLGANLKSARAELRTVYAAMVAGHPEVYKPQHHFQINARLLRDQINAEASTILWLLFGASRTPVCDRLLEHRKSDPCPHCSSRIGTGGSRRAGGEHSRDSQISVGGKLGSMRQRGHGRRAGGHPNPHGTCALRVAVFGQGRGFDCRFRLALDGLALALAPAVFLAFAPRLPSEDSSRGPALTGGADRVTGSRRRIRVFTVVQIAASFLLLASAGVLLTTLLSMQKVQPGFETGHVLVADLPLISDGRTQQQVGQFYQKAQLRASALPGVESATAMFAPWLERRF